MDGMESLPLPGMLAGRVALVTGAGNGIGRATARHLAAMGATVGVNDLKPEFVGKVVEEITAGGGRAVGVVQNIASRGGMRAAVTGLAERCGRLDVLINNAAWVRYQAIPDVAPETVDRMVEIGCIEMVNRVPTGRTFHAYFNPDRAMPLAAEQVHGLSDAFLADKKRFHEHALELIDFIEDSPLVAHNAGFDFGFLNAELGRCQLDPVCLSRMIDTVALARVRHPGAKLSLDALCTRYGIDRSHRTKHGALLDAGLLADVFLAMTRGQDSLVIDVLDDDALTANFGPIDVSQLIAVAVAAEEIAAHEALLDLIAREAKVTPVWRLSLVHA